MDTGCVCVCVWGGISSLHTSEFNLTFNFDDVCVSVNVMQMLDLVWV